MPEYVAIAKDRIDLAEKGNLRIRPMERPVYDPENSGKSIPPKTITLENKEIQFSFFDNTLNHSSSGEKL